MGVALAQAGLDPESPASRAIRAAAGDHARRAQIEERGFGASRDLAQTAVNRTVCERQGELVDLVRRNNAGTLR